MKLATFNVNSLKARLPIVLEWLAAHQPDVLCLQEIKGMDIPEMELRGAGYHIYAHTQKAYNGVMTLSRAEMNVVATTLPGFPDDEHARVMVTSFVTPTLTLPPSGGGNSSAPTPLYIINIYAPNGNPVGTDKYTYKLRWLNALYNYLKDLREQGRDVVVMGDFNIIPERMDAAHPDDWQGDALFQDEVRALYRAILYLGYTDALKTIECPSAQAEGPVEVERGPRAKPEGPDLSYPYTFWDYQAGAWQRNNGIRIDHVLLSPRLADRLVTAYVDRAPRALDRPSDHTPVVVELAD